SKAAPGKALRLGQHAKFHCGAIADGGQPCLAQQLHAVPSGKAERQSTYRCLHLAIHPHPHLDHDLNKVLVAFYGPRADTKFGLSVRQLHLCSTRQPITRKLMEYSVPKTGSLYWLQRHSPTVLGAFLLTAMGISLAWQSAEWLRVLKAPPPPV